MRFRRSVLFLVRERHPSINLSRINFASIEDNNVTDPNDGSTVVPTDEVGDDKGDDLEAPEDGEGAPNANLVVTASTMDIASSKANVPLPHCN